jgi:hypothetical protein
MKKTYLLTVFSLYYFFNHAQVIEKGKKILGGSLDFGFSHNQADTLASSGPSIKGGNSYLTLSPSFGKAIKNNMIFGYHASAGFSHSKRKDLRLKTMGKTNGYSITAGIFWEKFFPLNKSFSFSGHVPLRINCSSSKNKTFDNSVLLSTSTNKFYGLGIYVSPSLNYSLNKKFLMQIFLNDFISIGYGYNTSEMEGINLLKRKQSNSNLGVNTRINHFNTLSNLSFGFRYLL